MDVISQTVYPGQCTDREKARFGAWIASILLSYWRKKLVCSKPSVIDCEPRSLNDLPDEILLKILSHFGPEELCLTIAKVCEKWNVLAKDVALWKKLSYECDSSSDISRITEVLTAAPALHSLVIRQHTGVADILKLLIAKPFELRKLILENCLHGEDSTGLLANIVEKYPDLEVLSLEGCRPLTSASYSHIAELKKLFELNLSHCKELNGKTLRLIADGCQHLKKLRLNGVRRIYGDEDIIHIIKNLGKQLTTLVLDEHGLTDVAYSYLNNCARLQELRLSCCKNMTDRGLQEGIGSLHELTSLCLNWGRNLTAEALSQFLHRPSMTSIVLLDLSSCRHLDDKGLEGISKRCTRLKELAVCWCPNITDAGISMVIKHCIQLRVLNLGGVLSITGEGCLALVPSHLPHLRVLCLENCPAVCDTYVEELVAAVPELKVIK